MKSETGKEHPWDVIERFFSIRQKTGRKVRVQGVEGTVINVREDGVGIQDTKDKRYWFPRRKLESSAD